MNKSLMFLPFVVFLLGLILFAGIVAAPDPYVAILLTGVLIGAVTTTPAAITITWLIQREQERRMRQKAIEYSRNIIDFLVHQDELPGSSREPRVLLPVTDNSDIL